MKTICRYFTVFCFLCVICGLSGAAGETVSRGESAVAPMASTEGRTAIRTGLDLERSWQWLKAIEHYRKVGKRWPQSREFQSGLRRSKIHFGIARRYSDRSFESKLLRQSKAESLTLFDSVLLQVRTQYVEPISSTSFVAHGTESFYVALANNKFRQHNLRGVDPERISRLRKILRDEFWNKPIPHRSAARETVSRICEIAGRQTGLPASVVVLEYIFGGCNALDDYSSVLTPNRLDDLYGNIDGEFVGLGIEMKAETGEGMLLVNVLSDSPAERGGLKRDEHIIGIDSSDCRNMTTDEAARLLRGSSGTSVRLRITSAHSARVRNRVFKRKAVRVKSIPVATLVDRDAGIAYIQLTGFQKTSATELDAALSRLRRQGMRSLIWDVRGNPGGLLTAAVEVLDRFVDKGVLVSTKGRTQGQNWKYTARRIGTWDLPLVLLVDGDSASASEIVAGAVRDQRRGVIVGRQTFGKWSVQSIFPIRNGTGLRLTTAKFYSPHGRTYGKVGISPDVVVKNSSRHVVGYHGTLTASDVKADDDLQRGIQILRGQSARRSMSKTGIDEQDGDR